MKDLRKDILKGVNLDWQDLFERMSIGFAVRKIIFNKKGEATDIKYIDVNPIFVKYSGLSKKELLGKTLKELNPKMEKQWLEKYQGVLKTGKPAMFEQEMAALGKLFRVYAVKSGDDVVETVFADITTLKNVDKLIEESESKYQAIVKSSQDAIVMMDNKGKVTSWNPSAERMFGYREAEVLGKDLHDLITVEEEHRKKKTRLNTFFKTGESPILGNVLTLPVKNKKGVTFFIELTVSATKVEESWFGVGIMRDITGRKRMEEELQKESVLMETFINSVDDLVFCKDIHGAYLICNETFARKYFGKSKEQIIGKTDTQLFKKGDVVLNFVLENDSKVLKNGEKVDVEWEAKLADEKIIKLETIKTPLRNEEGEIIGLVGVSRDVNNRRKMEDELKERVRMSEILNKVMVDREIKMIELKKEIANLKKNGK